MAGASEGSPCARAMTKIRLINQSLLQVLFNKASLALPDSLSRELDELVADPDRGDKQLIEKLAEVGVHIRASSTALEPFRRRDEDLDEAAPFLELEECALPGHLPPIELRSPPGLRRVAARPG